MRLVFLAFFHGFGGAEKQIVMLANAMIEKGYDVFMVSISDNRCNYDLDENVKTFYIPDRNRSILRLVTRYCDIKKMLKQIRPDVTVSFWFQPVYLTAFMPKSITGKIVYSERGDPLDKEYSGVLALIRKAVLPRVDGLVFQFENARNCFPKSKATSIVIPNPVFVKRERYPLTNARKHNVVTVGRLNHQKNHKLLIDAFALVSELIPDYILEIYGEGCLEQELKGYIHGIGMDNRVYLRGTSRNIHDLIYDSGMFVLSSDYEGMPNVLLEAMALGIPCITTDCRPGGAREIITDGVSGILVPIGNCKILSQKILEVINNPKEAETRARMALKTVQYFRPDGIYHMWDSFFLKIVDN